MNLTMTIRFFLELLFFYSTILLEKSRKTIKPLSKCVNIVFLKSY